MDVVYVVRQGQDNQQLRYSLRSLANIDHDTVWIVGFKPSWVVDVEHMPTRQIRTRYENSTANLLTACSHPDVSDEFAYFNDDFFALQPTTVPTWHGGEIPANGPPKAARSWRDGRTATVNLLAEWGIQPAYNYDLHVPIVLEKSRMMDAVRRASKSKIVALHKRTLYGNLYQVGGVEHADVKIHVRNQRWEPGQEWGSTTSSSFKFGQAGKQIRALFPDPSPYERD